MDITIQDVKDLVFELWLARRENEHLRQVNSSMAAQLELPAAEAERTEDPASPSATDIGDGAQGRESLPSEA